MKHSFYSFSLSVLGICLLFTGEAQAVCDRTAMYGGLFNFSSPGWKTLFGAYTNANASAGNECIYNQAEFPRGNFLSEINESESRAKVESKDNGDNEILSEKYSTADISTFTVSIDTNLVNTLNGAKGTAKANVVDLILVINPDGTSSDAKKIPITWCSEYNSDAKGQMGSHYTQLQYMRFPYGGEHYWLDTIYYEGPNYITHKDSGGKPICKQGSINVTGKYSFFTLGLSTYDQGKVDIVPYDNGGNSINRKGGIKGYFKWTLPSGLKCYSASGKFPGCKPCRYDPHNTTYKSPTLAAIDAINKAGLEKDVKAIPEDKVKGYEYGGEIYPVPVCPVDAPYRNYDGGYLNHYTYTYRRQLPLGGSFNPNSPNVAVWHTHAFPFPQCQWYATHDLNAVKYLPLFLGLPHRDLAVKLLPKDSDSSCDEIVLEGYEGSLKPADMAGYEGNCESMCEQILLEKGIIDAEGKLTY